MPNFVEVKISGLDQLQKALEQEQPKKAKAILRSALRPAAKMIQDAMVQNAPKDSGFLAEHIGVKVSVRGEEIQGKAFVGPQGKVDYPRRGLAGKGRTIAAATVARFHEFGTQFMAANPFMTRAFEGNKEGAMQKIIAVIREKLGL